MYEFFVILFRQVEYAFTDKRAQDYLYIDQRTGEVTLYKDVDYEKRKEIHTIVELRDKVSKTVYDYAHLIISIKDFNDNNPRIKYTVIPPATKKVRSASLSMHKLTNFLNQERNCSN